MKNMAMMIIMGINVFGCSQTITKPKYKYGECVKVTFEFYSKVCTDPLKITDFVKNTDGSFNYIGTSSFDNRLNGCPRQFDLTLFDEIKSVDCGTVYY